MFCKFCFCANAIHVFCPFSTCFFSLSLISRVLYISERSAQVYFCEMLCKVFVYDVGDREVTVMRARLLPAPLQNSQLSLQIQHKIPVWKGTFPDIFLFVFLPRSPTSCPPSIGNERRTSEIELLWSSGDANLSSEMQNYRRTVWRK